MTSCGGTFPLRKPGTLISLPSGAINSLLHRVRLDVHLDPHARVAQLGDRGPHRRRSLLIAPRSNAAVRSIAKASRRPTGPVTSQARSRSRIVRVPSSPAFAVWSLLTRDPLAQPLALPRGHRPRGPGLLERDSTLGGEVEEALALLALSRRTEEQPREQAQGDEALLDHHQDPGGALVGKGRDSVLGLSRR